MARQTNYEVMVQQGGNWQIHARFTGRQKDEAIEEAKQLDSTSGIGQVRVVKDVYDPDEGISEEYVIYKSSTHKSSGGGGGGRGSGSDSDDWGDASGGSDGWDDWEYEEEDEEESGGFWSSLKKSKKSSSDDDYDDQPKKQSAKQKAAAAFSAAKGSKPSKARKPPTTPVVLVKILLVVFFGVMIGIIIALTGQFAMEQMALSRVVTVSKQNQANIMFGLFVLGFLGTAIPMALKFLKSDDIKTPGVGGGFLASLFRAKARANSKRGARGDTPAKKPRRNRNPSQDLEEFSADDPQPASEAEPEIDPFAPSEVEEFETETESEPEEEPAAEEEKTEEPKVTKEADDLMLPPHAEEQRAYMKGFIGKVLAESAADAKKMDNFNKFGVNLFLAGACEVLASKKSLDDDSKAKILSETVQTMGFKKDHAASFSDKYQEYLMADSRYMQMFQAGRNAMNTFFSDESAAPGHLNQSLEEWNKPKQKEENAGPVTVMFTDMVGSTSLTQTLGDQGAQKVVRAHNRVVREALTQYGGREVKHTGDGIMCSFPTTSNSVECAVMIQKGVLKHNVDNPDLPLGVKIGINAGEPIQEDNDLFGTTVQLAARIVDKAGNYEVFVSEIVRGICAGTTIKFKNRGQYDMKGIEDKITLYEVEWRDAKDLEMEAMVKARSSQAPA